MGSNEYLTDWKLLCGTLCVKDCTNVLINCDMPNNKVRGLNMGLAWVLSAPDGPHVGPMNLAIRDDMKNYKSQPTDVLTKRTVRWRFQILCSR